MVSDVVTATPRDLPQEMTERLPDLLADIETLGRCESPSAELDAVTEQTEWIAL